MTTILNKKISKLENLLDDLLMDLESLPPMKFVKYKELILEKIDDFTDRLSLAEETPYGNAAASDHDYDYYNEDEIEHYVDDEEEN